MRTCWPQFACAFLLSASLASGQISLLNPPVQAPIETTDEYQPITAKQRLSWIVKSTVGPKSLGTGVFTAAIATAGNHPSEYGPHWDGFGKRYGIRLTSISVGHAMEAGLGAMWAEDPRYFRAKDPALGGRLKHVVVMTFAARHPDGNLAPAYARFIAIPASNVISNSWRADSVSTGRDAAERTAWGFVGRMGSNAFAEFWPDLKRHIFHRRKMK